MWASFDARKSRLVGYTPLLWSLPRAYELLRHLTQKAQRAMGCGFFTFR